MSSYSPYAINVADPPTWRPGVKVTTGAFVGMTMFLVVEVNVLIHRAFKKRRGLYFWSMQLGSLGVFFGTLGLILKNFGGRRTDSIWPLYVLFANGGWAIHMTAQSLVLYSRLHLVVQNQKIQRYVFRMILSTVFTFVIPTIAFSFPAYNTWDHEMSSVWSPRILIVVRFTQIGYTITESIISGLYIWSLLRLMKFKSNVRSRRVMTDLIYVNVVAIAFDILTVGLVFTNQNGVAFPVQEFSYIFKLRLEFVVLNQLMDLAARGIRREHFRRNRYYLPANQGNRHFHCNDSSQEMNDFHRGPAIDNDLPKGPPQTELSSFRPLPDSRFPPNSTGELRPASRSASDVQTSGPESEPGSISIDHDGNPLTQTAKSGAGFMPPQAPEDFKHLSSGRSKHPKPLALGRVHRSHRENTDNNEKVEEEEDDDDEDIDPYMWERGGAQVPWFRSKVDA